MAEHTYDPGVPFPRTVPRDAPEPPNPLLDQRAARALFAHARREHGAIGYRLADSGVAVQHADGTEQWHSWADVVEYARGLYPEPDDPDRRDRRQQRRRDRRDR